MRNAILKFAKSEDGAITVDWVVLTAAAAFLGVAVLFVIGPAATGKSDDIGAYIDTMDVHTTF